MPDNKLKQFHDSIKGNPNISGVPEDFSRFESALKNPSTSKAFFDAISKNEAIGGLPKDYNTFASSLGIVEKKNPNAPTASSGMGVLLAGKGKAQKSVSEQIISELPKTTTTTKVKEPEEDGKYWERTKSTLSTLGKSVVDGVFATSAKQIAIVSKTIDDEVREMVGMKPLSKPIEEYQTYQWGKSIESATDKTFQPNPEFKGELQEQVAQTAGDLLGLVATAIITKNPSSALAKLGTTGIVKQLANSATRKAITREIAKESVKMLAKPTTFVAAAQTGTRNYDEAKSKGATDDQANAMFWSTALTGGIVNNLPVGSLLSRFDKATGGKMKDMVVGGVVGGIEEAVTESIEQISTNFAAKNIYDETRTLFEGVEESAAMGGGFGFVLNAMGVKLGSLRNKYKGNPEKIAEIDQSIDYIKDIAEKEGQGSAIKLSKEEKNQVDRYSEIINNPQSTPEEIDIANEKIQEITGQKIIDAENTTQLISGLSEDAQIDLKLIDSEIDRLRDAAEKSRNVEIKDRLESDILNLQNKKNTIINSVSQETTQKPSVSGRIIEPDKPITEMDSEELYDYAIKYKKALQAQDKEFLNKTEAEKEAGGYYDIIDEVESLRDTSEKMNFIENSENVSELADSLKSIFNKIRSSGPDEYQTSLINAAKKKSQELGIGTEDLIKTIAKKISKDYNDATDAELMVKDFLGKVSGTKSPNDTIKNPAPSVLPNIPASTKPVTFQDQVDQLRADEQAEYDAMSDPNNEAARKKIYDKYDEKITPLLKEIVESTAKELKATDQAGTAGVGGEVQVLQSLSELKLNDEATQSLEKKLKELDLERTNKLIENKGKGKFDDRLKDEIDEVKRKIYQRENELATRRNSELETKIKDGSLLKLIADNKITAEDARGLIIESGIEVPSEIQSIVDKNKKYKRENKQSIIERDTDFLGNEKEAYMVNNDKANGVRTQEDVEYFKSNVKRAIDSGKYQKAIADGKMTANDARIIIKSYGLKIPKDILEQLTSETSQANTVGVGGGVEAKIIELEIERDNKLAEIKDENIPENKKTELDNQISDKKKKQEELDKNIANAEKQVNDTLLNLDKASKEYNDLADKILIEESLTNQEREIAASEKAKSDTVNEYLKKSFRQYLKGVYNGGLSDFFKKVKDKLRKVLLAINISAIMTTHVTGDFSFNQYVDLAKNYSERHLDIKPDSQLQTVTLKVNNNKLEDNLGVNKIPYKSGYATNQIINLEGNSFEARNRADLTPVQNAIGITTNLFKPFQEVSNFKGVLPRASDSVKQNPPVIAFNKKTSNVKAGNLKDFNNDWLVSETFTIPLEFKTDANGQIKTVYHGQAQRNVPVTTVNGKDIPFPIGLDTKNKTIDPTKHNTFGVLEGGKVILSVGNYQVQVNGGFADIYSAWKELKSKNPNKEITAYLLDNGSYNLPILKNDGVVTSEDLTKQTLRNKDGGTSLVLKQKIPQEAASYPHGYQKIETDNFRKDSTGNKVENKPTAIVLHHTGEYKGGEKDVIKEFTAPKGNSSHYLIGKDGKIYQFNDGSYVMFHAGESLFKGKEDLNSSSIGIEIQGDSENSGDFTKEQYESIVSLVYQLAKNYNIPIGNIVDHKTIRDNYLKAHPEDKATKEKVDLNGMVMKHIVKELQKAYPKIEQQQIEQHDTTTEKGKSEMPVSTPLEVLGALQGLDLAIRAYRRRKANKASEKNIEPEQPNVAASTKKLIDNPAKEVALSRIEDLQKSLDNQKVALEDLRKDKLVNQKDIDNFQKQIDELTAKSKEILAKNNSNENARNKIKQEYDDKIKAVEQSVKETPKAEETTEPVTLQDQVDQFRKDEKAEYDALPDPNDEAAKKSEIIKLDTAASPAVLANEILDIEFSSAEEVSTEKPLTEREQQMITVPQEMPRNSSKFGSWLKSIGEEFDKKTGTNIYKGLKKILTTGDLKAVRAREIVDSEAGVTIDKVKRISTKIQNLIGKDRKSRELANTVMSVDRLDDKISKLAANDNYTAISEILDKKYTPSQIKAAMNYYKNAENGGTSTITKKMFDSIVKDMSGIGAQKIADKRIENAARVKSLVGKILNYDTVGKSQESVVVEPTLISGSQSPMLTGSELAPVGVQAESRIKDVQSSTDRPVSLVDLRTELASMPNGKEILNTLDKSIANQKAAESELSKTEKGRQILEQAKKARELIDSFADWANTSQAANKINKRIGETLAGNKGSYLKRSFRYWKDKKFEPSEAMKLQALESVVDDMMIMELTKLKNSPEYKRLRGDAKRQYLTQIADDVRRKAKIELDTYMDENRQKREDGTGFSINTKAEKIDGKTLSFRKLIDESFLDLLGNVNDPISQFHDTVVSQTQIKSAANFHWILNEVTGKENIYDSREQLVEFNGSSKGFKQINDSNSVLDGKWVSEDIYDVISSNAPTKDGTGYLVYRKILSTMRKSKTIYNFFAGWTTNLIGGEVTLAANGIVNNPKKIGKYLINRAKYIKNPEALTADIQKDIDAMKDNGFWSTSVSAGTIKLLDDNYMDMTAYDRGDETARTATRRWIDKAKRFDDNVVRNYSVIDDFTKLVFFREKKDVFSRKLYGKKFDELSKEEQNIVHANVAERGKENIATMSRLPRIYHKIAKYPLGDFMAFRISAIKSGINTINNARRDIEQGYNKDLSPEQRKAYLEDAFKTLAGMSTAAILNSSLYGAMSTLAMGLMSDDDEEVFNPVVEDGVDYGSKSELYTDFKGTPSVNPQWMRGKNNVVIKDDGKGNIELLNISNKDPYDELFGLFLPRAGTSWDETLGGVLMETISPNMTVNLLMNIKNGEDQWGRSIFTGDDTTFEKGTKIAGYVLTEALVPPAIKNTAKETYKEIQQSKAVEGDTKKEINKKTVGGGEYFNALLKNTPMLLNRTYKVDLAEQFGYYAKEFYQARPEKFGDLDKSGKEKRYEDLKRIKDGYEYLKRYSILNKNSDFLDTATEQMFEKARGISDEEQNYILYGEKVY